jgi:N-acetylmuramoyl-L-alanine amidase
MLSRGLTVGVVLFLITAGAIAHAANVDAVRIATQDDRTRVALDLSGQVEHKIFTLPGDAQKPARVVVDIKPSRLGAGVLPFPEGAGSVSRIRGADREDGSVRIVLDLTRAARPRSFVLPPDGEYGHRLVLDLESAIPVTAAQARPVRRAPAITQAARDLVIAIDAGHGGKDPGARGPKGVREKDVVLQISRRLAQEIDAEPGMRAFLTRDRDEFVPLRSRSERARAAQADLFISIHADAFHDRRVRGTTVYALSQKGASDEAARRLAERENAADLIGGVTLDDKDPTLASVLLDLSQNASLSTSIAVGDEILDELAGFTRVRKRQVQQAPFLVLKSPDVPSVLIETAYISNPDDERNLASAHHQTRLAAAILEGVRDYFYANPPAGTRVAELAKAGPRVPRQYVIRSGDTLSGIAARYRLSLRNIRSINNLRNDRITVGQVLRLPQPTDT